MPCRAAASTILSTALAPARWPAVRGSPRCEAQRPLPSMMIAMCTISFVSQSYEMRKSCAAGCLDHRFDMIEVSIQGVLAEHCQPIDSPRAALFEGFGAGQVLGLFQLARVSA